MRLFITCDSFWEAKVDKVLDALYETGYKSFFDKQDYGSSLDCIAVVLMCQDPNLKLKQRIRLSKKEKTLYIDIMLDLNLFIEITQEDREKITVEKLISEIPPIIAKYKLQDFNLEKFKKDLSIWVRGIPETFSVINPRTNKVNTRFL